MLVVFLAFLVVFTTFTVAVWSKGKTSVQIGGEDFGVMVFGLIGYSSFATVLETLFGHDLGILGWSAIIAIILAIFAMNIRELGTYRPTSKASAMAAVPFVALQSYLLFGLKPEDLSYEWAVNVAHFFMFNEIMISVTMYFLFVTFVSERLYDSHGTKGKAIQKPMEEPESSELQGSESDEGESIHPARLAVVNAIPDANIPEGLKKDVIFVAAASAPLERKTKDVIEAIELWATTLPPHDLCVAGPGRAWGEYVGDFAKTCEHPEYAYTDAFLPFVTAQNILGDMMPYLNGIEIAVRLKPEYRYEHTHIIGGSGHGKTQLLQDLILDDLVNEDISIVVIDSQQDMLEKLLHVVPPERLVYLDPTHPEFALALDTFRGGSSEDEVTTSVDLYEFMFASLENELTAKQQTVYRYVSRLLFEVPNANLLTMLDVLEHGTANYRKYMLNLNPVVINFFDNQFDVKRGQYGETKNQIAQRLYRLLENPTLQRMFTAPVGKIDLGKELQKPNVILINTASGSISIEGAKLLGRYMIAQIASFALSGKKTVPTMLYIDEAQEYLSASPIVVRMFQQGRKRRLGITAAHQDLGALVDPALRSTLSANTTIKLAGGVSGEDVAAMARDMRVTKDEIDAMPKNSFLCSVRGVGTIARKTDFLRLEKSPQKSPQEITAIKQHMAQTYGYKAATNASASSQPPLNDPDAPQDLD